MSTEVAVVAGQEEPQRLPIGLLVKTGAPKPERGPGRPLDHFRFDEGDQGQYAEAATLARKEYGDEPKQLDDVILLSNRVGDVLDIRIQAWSQSGRRIWGNTNFATIDDRDEFIARLSAWDDSCLYFPRQVAEVPPRMRDTWEGEPIEFTLDGPDDPRIKKYEMSVRVTMRFGLPRALGLGSVALYSSASRKNLVNLYEGLWFAHRAFEGNVVGIPFRLRVEPRKTQRFDKEEKAYKVARVQQVTLTTPFTMQEAIDAIRERHEALGSGKRLELTAGESSDFFRSDDRDDDEANEPAFIPVESFDPELRDPDEAEVVEGEYEEPGPFAGIPTQTDAKPEPEPETISSFEDLLPEAVKKGRK